MNINIWDLEIDDNTLNRLLSNDLKYLINSLLMLSKNSEPYKRAIGLDLNYYEFTTSESLYLKTGIYSIGYNRKSENIKIIGNTDIFIYFKNELVLVLNYINNYYDIDIIGLGHYNNIELKNSKYKYNINSFIGPDIFKSPVFIDFMNLYPAICNSELQIDSFIGLNFLYESLNNLIKNFGGEKKLNLLTLNISNHNFGDLLSMKQTLIKYDFKKYTDKLYLFIDCPKLSKLLLNNSKETVLKFLDFMESNDIEFISNKELESLPLILDNINIR